MVGLGSWVDWSEWDGEARERAASCGERAATMEPALAARLTSARSSLASVISCLSADSAHLDVQKQHLPSQMTSRLLAKVSNRWTNTLFLRQWTDYRAL